MGYGWANTKTNKLTKKLFKLPSSYPLIFILIVSKLLKTEYCKYKITYCKWTTWMMFSIFLWDAHVLF